MLCVKIQAGDKDTAAVHYTLPSLSLLHLRELPQASALLSSSSICFSGWFRDSCIVLFNVDVYYTLQIEHRSQHVRGRQSLAVLLRYDKIGSSSPFLILRKLSSLTLQCPERTKPRTNRVDKEEIGASHPPYNMSVSFKFEDNVTEYNRGGPLIRSTLGVITDFTVTLVGTSVYFIGQLHKSRQKTDLLTFDFTTSHWGRIQAQGPSLSKHTTCLHNDKLYCIGGANTTSYFTIYEAEVELWVFDLLNREWSKAAMGGRPPMRNPNLGPWKDQYIAEILGKYLVTYRVHRSWNKALGHASSLVALQLDDTDTIWAEPWQKGQSPSPRLKMCSCSTDNAVFVYGGEFNRFSEGGLYRLTVLGGTFYWSELRPSGVNKLKVVGCSMVGYDGRIFVFGGCRDQGLVTNQCCYYDLRRKKWVNVDVSNVENMHVDHHAVATQDCIMYFGGKNIGFPGMLQLSIEYT